MKTVTIFLIALLLTGCGVLDMANRITDSSQTDSSANIPTLPGPKVEKLSPAATSLNIFYQTA